LAYTPNIPQATDRPSDSQSLMLANFTAIDTVNSINHVAFDDASGDQGKHKYISFPVQATSPLTPPFVSGEVGMYSFLNAATNKNELYISKLNQATDTQIPFTASSLSLVSAPAANTSGWSYLPSGLLIKWGMVTGSGIVNAVYDATVPFGAVFSVNVSPTSGTGSSNIKVNVHSSLNSKVEVKCTLHSNYTVNANVTFYYFAVGRPA